MSQCATLRCLTGRQHGCLHRGHPNTPRLRPIRQDLIDSFPARGASRMHTYRSKRPKQVVEDAGTQIHCSSSRPPLDSNPNLQTPNPATVRPAKGGKNEEVKKCKSDCGSGIVCHIYIAQRVTVPSHSQPLLPHSPQIESNLAGADSGSLGWIVRWSFDHDCKRSIVFLSPSQSTSLQISTRR